MHRIIFLCCRVLKRELRHTDQVASSIVEAAIVVATHIVVTKVVVTNVVVSNIVTPHIPIPIVITKGRTVYAVQRCNAQ